MPKLHVRPRRRTFPKTVSTPTVMAQAFASAGWDTFDPRQVSPRIPEPQSRQTPEHVRAPIRLNVYRRNSSGVFGKVPELDLHGRNQDQAYEMLGEFIRKRRGDGYRKVLVITGKGSGILKRLVPLWLEEAPLKEFVDGTHVAEPWHGGEGALQVYLRRC